jgi:hypothetical protein
MGISDEPRSALFTPACSPRSLSRPRRVSPGGVEAVFPIVHTPYYSYERFL